MHCGLQFSTPIHILGAFQYLNQIANKPALAGTTYEILGLVQSCYCRYHNSVQARMLSGSAVCLTPPALQLAGKRPAAGPATSAALLRG